MYVRAYGFVELFRLPSTPTRARRISVHLSGKLHGGRPIKRETAASAGGFQHVYGADTGITVVWHLSAGVACFIGSWNAFRCKLAGESLVSWTDCIGSLFVVSATLYPAFRTNCDVTSMLLTLVHIYGNELYEPHGNAILFDNRNSTTDERGQGKEELVGAYRRDRGRDCRFY